MTQLHIFTSAALNYIPKVRLLAESVKKHHPEARFHLALADLLPDDIDLSREPFDSILRIPELGIAGWPGWVFCHRLVELATAIKPFALYRLLHRPGTEKVLYLDPDIVVFSRLDDLLAELDGHSVVLTPHLAAPEQTLRGVMDNEISSLRHGIFNLGFIGVSNRSHGIAFARWWRDRLYHFCRDDIPHGLFTDQRWVDLAPALFPEVCIHRGSRHNVATWNIANRRLTRDENGTYRVDGEPLGFYHFTGLDSGAHAIMAAVHGGKSGVLFDLIHAYIRASKAQENDPLGSRPWAFGCFADGTPITAVQRIVYRERPDLQRAFPDPFAADGYLRWWKTQAMVEFPELGRPGGEEELLKRITADLRSGFVATDDEFGADDTAVRALLNVARRDSSSRRALIRHAWQVFRQEGPAGVLQRMRRRGGRD
jgi:hypothetical protein